MDSEIKKDIEDSKENRSSGISIVDSKYVANFTVNKNEPDYSYESYQKIFDNVKDYSDYLEKFFKL